MARKSTKHVGSVRGAPVIDHPFDADIVVKAKEIASQYRIILEPDDNCGYIGSSLEMPWVYNDGKTADACVEAVREALTAAVAYLIESGTHRLPVPKCVISR